MYNYQRRLFFTGNREAYKNQRRLIQATNRHIILDKNNEVVAVILQTKIDKNINFNNSANDHEEQQYKNKMLAGILKEIPKELIDKMSETQEFALILKLHQTVIDYNQYLTNKTIKVNFLGHIEGGLYIITNDDIIQDAETAISRREGIGYETPDEIMNQFITTNSGKINKMLTENQLTEYYIVIRMSMTNIDRSEVAKRLQAEKDSIEEKIAAARKRHAQDEIKLKTKIEEKFSAAKNEEDIEKIKIEAAIEIKLKAKNDRQEISAIKWNSVNASCSQSIHWCLTGRNLGEKKSAQNGMLRTLYSILLRDDKEFVINMTKAIQASGVKVSSYVLGKEKVN